MITRSQWIEIAKSYYQAKLAFEHIQHQMTFIQIGKNDQIFLISPKSGVIKLPNTIESKMMGELAFEVIDTKAIKVKVSAPLQLTSSLSHFEVNSLCHLTIDNIEKIADKHHQILWGTPTSTDCHLLLGQTVKVTPVQTFKGYKIAKSAIFEFENQNFIALKNDNALSVVPIVLMGANESDFIFTTESDIEGKQVLVSSVSILQGSLLSLGAE